eukprot:XP_011675356.1 PREDICTED: protein eyes shut homolog [Strongylocentrotus purpuratus]
MSSIYQTFSTQVTGQMSSTLAGMPSLSSLPVITSSENPFSTSAAMTSYDLSTLNFETSFFGSTVVTPSMTSSLSSVVVTTTLAPTPEVTTPHITPTPTMEPSTTASPPVTCETSPCLNGGVCRNQTSLEGLVFECDCTFRFTGSFCETERAVHFPSFSGNSFLEYAPLDWSSSSSNSIFITIKTSTTEGSVLLSASDSDEFIHLFIQGGRLVYQMSCGLGQIVRVESSVVVATDELVEVFIR